MLCHWCKSLLPYETKVEFGGYTFCCVEHRAYYRAGLEFKPEGLRYVEAHHDAKT